MQSIEEQTILTGRRQLQGVAKSDVGLNSAATLEPEAQAAML